MSVPEEIRRKLETYAGTAVFKLWIGDVGSMRVLQ